MSCVSLAVFPGFLLWFSMVFPMVSRLQMVFSSLVASVLAGVQARSFQGPRDERLSCPFGLPLVIWSNKVNSRPCNNSFAWIRVSETH